MGIQPNILRYLIISFVIIEEFIRNTQISKIFGVNL